MTVAAINGPEGFAGVQSRISDIQSRFMDAGNVWFGSVLANHLGGLRTSSAWRRGPTPPRGPGGLSPAVDIAQRYLGTPYVWGGEPPPGFDCSGLLQYVYGQLGVDLSRVAADQARAGRPVASLAEARPGDLIAFGEPVDHIGIYAGDNRMVVAPKTGDVVKVQEIYRTPSTIRRVLPAGSGAPFASGLSAQRSILLSALGGMS